MRSLVIVIILLSLIGLYINLGSAVDMDQPELKRVENKNLSADEIAEKIIEEMEVKPEFDRMGNSLKVGDGLESEKRILNLNVTSGNAPNTRPNKWTTTTKREIGKYGIVKNTLSYKNNYPYDKNYLADIESKDRLRSSISTLARNPKAEPQLSQIILPQDESQFKEGFKFMDRAIAIIRNQTANENKILPDVRKIDSNQVSKRASKNIYRVMPDEIEIKTKPDTTAVQAAHDHAEVHSKLQKLDPVRHSITQMKSNYNFK
tara:strand:+ start:247 stop:1029 length:783 start_codon:yes stop_codon:yes gene_type:complete